MVSHDNRRKSRRHSAQWKVTLVLDNSGGEPIILHTHTVDLSLGGMSIVSERDQKAGSDVTVLLVQPLQRNDEKPEILKARARIVSSATLDPGRRLGLRFIEWSDESLSLFARLVGTIEAAHAYAHANASAPAATATDSTTTSRLGRLREQAQARLAEREQGSDVPGASVEDRVSGALERAYLFLKDLSDQLNVVKPRFKGYAIHGVPEFGDLAWESSRADFRKKEVSAKISLYERVTLNYKLSGHKEISAVFDGVRSARLRQILAENRIEFTAREMRGERGALDRVNFVFPCEVTASVTMSADFTSGRVQMRLVNVGDFGVIEHWIVPAAVTDEALDEFAGFLLGESHRFDLLLRAGG